MDPRLSSFHSNCVSAALAYGWYKYIEHDIICFTDVCQVA